jgi:hypothetical protein
MAGIQVQFCDENYEPLNLEDGYQIDLYVATSKRMMMRR